MKDWQEIAIFQEAYFLKQFSFIGHIQLSTLRAHLSWTHYGLLSYIKNNEEREFYEIQTIRNSWSYRELEKRNNANEYQKAKRTGQIITTVPTPLPAPEEIFKNTYNWDFLEIGEEHTEKELEQAFGEEIKNKLKKLK